MRSATFPTAMIDDSTDGHCHPDQPAAVSTSASWRRCNRTRVLIASAHPIVRHGLRLLLTDEGDVDVIGEAEDGGAAVALAARLRPDVVVADLLMPVLDGIAVARRVRTEAADTRVVVISGVDDSVTAIESVRAGAVAYLLRETRTDVMVRAIRGASAGQVALPSQTAARLLRVGDRHESLSERESEVLRLVAVGKPNKQIARELAIAASTVKSHVGSILNKLGLTSRTQIAVYAARTGLLHLEQQDCATATG